MDMRPVVPDGVSAARAVFRVGVPGVPGEIVQDQTAVSELREIGLALWARKATIFWTAVLFVLPAIAFLLLTPSKYETHSEILLDPRAKPLVEGEVVPRGLGRSSVGADTLLVDSQSELIRSNAILQRVVNELKLGQDEEFYKPRGLGLRMRLRNLVGPLLPDFQPEKLPSQNRDLVALTRLRDRHLAVGRAGNTYVIRVAVMSTDAEKAALIANTIARTYVSDQSRLVDETTRAATQTLAGRLKDLRKRVREAEQRVEAFRAANGLLGTPGILNAEQQLRQLNENLTRARAETALAKAKLDQLSAGGNPVAVGDTPEALSYAVLSNLRASLSRIERRLAGLRQRLGPAHPDLTRARAERTGLQRSLQRELTRLKASAKVAFDVASKNEKTLEANLAKLEQRAAKNNRALIQLRELEREAQAARAVFQAFLTRTKQTQEQEKLDRTDARIISLATVPLRPSFPPTLLVLAIAGLAGLAAGTVLAWLRYVFGSGDAGAARAVAGVSPGYGPSPASGPPSGPGPASSSGSGGGAGPRRGSASYGLGPTAGVGTATAREATATAPPRNDGSGRGFTQRLQAAFRGRGSDAASSSPVGRGERSSPRADAAASSAPIDDDQQVPPKRGGSAGVAGLAAATAGAAAAGVQAFRRARNGEAAVASSDAGDVGADDASVDQRTPFAPAPQKPPTSRSTNAHSGALKNGKASLGRLPLIGALPSLASGRRLDRLADLIKRRGPQTDDAIPPVSFADVLGALQHDDEANNAKAAAALEAQRLYREAVQRALMTLQAYAPPSGPQIVLLAARDPDAGVSSTALALAYQAALAGRATLLVDADSQTPALSDMFVGALEQDGPCVLDNKAHLDGLLTRDPGSGLALLPIALADLRRLKAHQQRRLATGMAALSEDYDLVIIDAGALAHDEGALALLPVVSDVVLVGPPATKNDDALRRLASVRALTTDLIRGKVTVAR
ncbi:MAG: exopolysaccharide transport family protein [Pseudomonadota bacterium]